MFDFTRQERLAVLFLLAMAITGLGADFLLKTHRRIKYFPAFGENLFKVELNKADKEAFLNLPGIGEKTAQRILDYRQQAGGFKQVDELSQIKGLSGQRYEKIKAYFKVSQ